MKGLHNSVESVKNMNENMNTNLENDTTAEVQTQEPKTYTAEEVNKLIQSEADRRTNQALAKQRKEYEKKLSLSTLDEQQRRDAEAQMRIEELQNQLAEFQIERNKSELKSVLSSRGLSAEFADIIHITDDIEESQNRIESLDRLFKAAVKAEVEKRLAASGGTPKGASTNFSTELTKESFKKMPLSEQAALHKNNPELYRKLIN
jgi:hypothetical protein